MYTSPRKRFFHLLWGLLIISIIFVIGAHTYVWIQKNANQQTQQEISSLNRQLEKIGQADRFNKLEFARKIVQENSAKLSRTDRIQTIIGVLQKIQAVSYKGDIIRLSDFQISLDKLTLKGETVNIALLYHTIEGTHKSLFDTFRDLPFVSSIEVRHYQRAGTNSISFILTAHLDLDDSLSKSTNRPTTY